MSTQNPNTEEPNTEEPAAAENPVSDGPAAGNRPSRRSQAIAAIFLVAAAGLLWGATRMRWAEVYAEDGLGAPRTFDVLGSDWSPWLVAIAIFFLAALVVQFVLHGLFLRVVAVLVAAGAVAVAIPAVSLLTSGDNNLYAAEVIDLPARYDVVAITTSSGPGALVIIAAVFGVVGALAMARSAAGAVKMSSRYSSPAARREELERRVFAEYERGGQPGAGAPAPTEREFWDALDEGVDPTADRP